MEQAFSLRGVFQHLTQGGDRWAVLPWASMSEPVGLRSAPYSTSAVLRTALIEPRLPQS